MIPRSVRAMTLGKLLVGLGVVLTGIGLAIMAGLPIGRLPGDMVVRRGNFTLYVPVVTAIVLSLVLTLLLSLFRR